MLKIAICDDNPLFLEELESLLKEDERVGEVVVFQDAQKLLQEVERLQFFDAIFMDIELGNEKSGIQFAKQIFGIAPQIQLVYVTGYYEKYVQDVFLTEANLTGFLVKPVEREVLKQYLDKIYYRKAPRQVLQFSVRGREYLVATGSILYLESDNHKTNIHTEEQMYSVYDKLGNFIPKLPEAFLRCHKSFLVNMKKIRYIEGNIIHLQNGGCIPISKIHREKVRKSYFSYIGNVL